MKILIMLTDAGSGHRMTGEALKEVIEAHHPWQVTLVNPYREFLADIELFKRFTGSSGEALYTEWVLKRGHTRLLWPLLATAAYAQVHLQHAKGVKRAQAFWQKHQPDLVISVMPLLNRCLHESLQTVLPHVPFITIITDFCDTTPAVWFQNRDQFYICGTAKSVHQAEQVAAKKALVFATSGMVLSPKFYRPIAIDRRQARRHLGLAPDRPTGLVMFGGTSPHKLNELAEAINHYHRDRSHLPIQLIFLCGRNPAIAQSLRQYPTYYPKHIVEFTDAVPGYMHLADFFIGKPGPAAISEALAMGLPLLLASNRKTLFQERYNGQWVVENGFGRVFDGYGELIGSIDALVGMGQLQKLRKKMGHVQNHALFEALEAITSVLQFA